MNVKKMSLVPTSLLNSIESKMEDRHYSENPLVGRMRNIERDMEKRDKLPPDLAYPNYLRKQRRLIKMRKNILKPKTVRISKVRGYDEDFDYDEEKSNPPVTMKDIHTQLQNLLNIIPQMQSGSRSNTRTSQTTSGLSLIHI